MQRDRKTEIDRKTDRNCKLIPENSGYRYIRSDKKPTKSKANKKDKESKRDRGLRRRSDTSYLSPPYWRIGRGRFPQPHLRGAFDAPPPI